MLLRAAVPLAGLPVMARRRGRTAEGDLCSGPAKLAQAFGLTGADDGADLVRGQIRVTAGGPPVRASVWRGPRVGISRARETPWRFGFDFDLD